MHTIKYIWRNISRNRLKSTLTILSIGFSLSLMTVLYGYMAAQETWGADAALYNRIVVMNTQGFSGAMPIANVDRIRQMDGIKAAVPYAWYGGTYQDQPMAFAQFATDAEQAFQVWDEFRIDPEQLKAWKENRQGCVVDRRLAERWDWQIGDRIPIKGTYYPFDLDLLLVGVFDSPKNTDSLWFHWIYLDEGLKQMDARGTGNSGTIFAKVESAGQIPGVIQAIDDKFASSDTPSRSQTEAAFAQMFTDMMGNLQAYIQFIGLAVVFSLSLVAATSMAMSMRERVTEIAVLKAIGFSKPRVLGLVLGESFAVALLGGLFGVGLGCLCLQLMRLAMPQMFPFPIMDFVGLWTMAGIFVAAAIGFISGIVPAILAAQLSVIDGLRRVV